MTKSGFIVCNDKFVKIKDENGTVNLVGDLVKFREIDIKRAVEEQIMAD